MKPGDRVRVTHTVVGAVVGRVIAILDATVFDDDDLKRVVVLPEEEDLARLYGDSVRVPQEMSVIFCKPNEVQDTEPKGVEDGNAV